MYTLMKKKKMPAAERKDDNDGDAKDGGDPEQLQGEDGRAED